ncbi:MAG TPA: hypothetical protein ENJ08_08290 [Gammaproteobacteria bacterium]|nr:hypothetical protein [Gammaproteobacteria bacterium]
MLEFNRAGFISFVGVVALVLLPGYEGAMASKPVDKPGYDQYIEAAESGNVEAQYSLAKFYYGGTYPFMNSDFIAAEKWFRKAAMQGHAKAQVHLGIIYSRGQGHEKNIVEAEKWYRKSAEQGNIKGLLSLAYMYHQGRGGIEKNYVEAEKWFRKAALAGVPRAQFELGYYYEEGLGGVPRNYAEAERWYRKAAIEGNEEAAGHLGNLYYTGQGVQQDYQEAVKWLRIAVKRQDAYGQNILGVMYRYGHGVKQDYSRAIQLFKLAATQFMTSSPEAAKNLGDLFYFGEGGVQQNYIESEKWYRKAAERDLSAAQFSLGLLYEKGRGLQKNNVEAEKWYRKAAEQGYLEAQYSLARLYFFDSKNTGEVVKWYQIAAERGHVYAQVDLADIYYKGLGVPISYAEAEKWYAKAASQGHSVAQQRLESIRSIQYRQNKSEELSPREIGQGIGALLKLFYNNSNSATSRSGSPGGRGSDAEYVRCYNQALDRVAECKVVPQFNCTMIGCPDDKIECNLGWSGRACESDSAGSYYINTFGLKVFYCDTQNSDNRDSDINVVINNICLKD